jgi:predicted nucleotidyltransferase
MDIKSWLPNNIIYLSLSGSRAYKTHTEDSDYDYKGACIAPASYYLGMDRFDQSDSKETVEFIKPYLGSFPPDDDVVVYNLVKMISLTADGNPNMIEMVFVEPDSIVYRHPIMNRFFDIRDAFLSRNLKHRFSGYAMSQLKKMRNHKHWIDHPPVFPTRKMYGIEGVNLPKDQIFAVDKLIELQVGEWLVDETELPESTKIQLGPQMVRMVNTILEQLQIEHPVGGLRDILDRAATRHLGFSSDFLIYLQKYKAFKSALAEWHSYERWKTQRNPERLKLEMQCGYDCYLDDTEFLTDSGWKTYNSVTDSDKLGTLHPKSGNLEYQYFTSRISKSVDSDLYEIRMQQSNCVITENHKLWLTLAHRRNKRLFCDPYNDDEAHWGLKRVSDVISGKRSIFHIRCACTEPEEDYPISDKVLLLIGAYIAEGSMSSRDAVSDPRMIQISQHPDGKMIPILEQLRKDFFEESRDYYYERTTKEGRLVKERIYHFTNKELVNQILEWCGKVKTKRLPPWKDKLSKRQARIMLSSMLAGDGSEERYSSIYYTSLKDLADDIQVMCLSSGIVSQVWGPYHSTGGFKPHSMYQVYISKKDKIFLDFSKRHHLKPFITDRACVVCFDVPNGLLITRRRGKVAIQGNSKDAYSLYRLLRMCREILETGKVNVSREGIDADELRDLRHYGNKRYEDIIAWAEDEDKALDEVMKTSPLPKSPNRKLINETLTEVMSEYLFAGKKILPNVESLMAYYQDETQETKEEPPVGRQFVGIEKTGVIPVEDKYLKLTKILYDRGWVRTSEPNFNFYQDPQDGGLGPNQEVTWTRRDESIIITTDYTLRDVISVRKG